MVRMDVRGSSRHKVARVIMCHYNRRQVTSLPDELPGSLSIELESMTLVDLDPDELLKHQLEA